MHWEAENSSLADKDVQTERNEYKKKFGNIDSRKIGSSQHSKSHSNNLSKNEIDNQYHTEDTGSNQNIGKEASNMSSIIDENQIGNENENDKLITKNEDVREMQNGIPDDPAMGENSISSSNGMNQNANDARNSNNRIDSNVDQFSASDGGRSDKLSNERGNIESRKIGTSQHSKSHSNNLPKNEVDNQYQTEDIGLNHNIGKEASNMSSAIDENQMGNEIDNDESVTRNEDAPETQNIRPNGPTMDENSMSASNVMNQNANDARNSNNRIESNIDQLSASNKGINDKLSNKGSINISDDRENVGQLTDDSATNGDSAILHSSGMSKNVIDARRSNNNRDTTSSSNNKGQNAIAGRNFNDINNLNTGASQTSNKGATNRFVNKGSIDAASGTNNNENKLGTGIENDILDNSSRNENSVSSSNGSSHNVIDASFSNNSEVLNTGAFSASTQGPNDEYESQKLIENYDDMNKDEHDIEERENRDNRVSFSSSGPINLNKPYNRDGLGALQESRQGMAKPDSHKMKASMIPFSQNDENSVTNTNSKDSIQPGDVSGGIPTEYPKGNEVNKSLNKNNGRQEKVNDQKSVSKTPRKSIAKRMMERLKHQRELDNMPTKYPKTNEVDGPSNLRPGDINKSKLNDEYSSEDEKHQEGVENMRSRDDIMDDGLMITSTQYPQETSLYEDVEPTQSENSGVFISSYPDPNLDIRLNADRPEKNRISPSFGSNQLENINRLSTLPDIEDSKGQSAGGPTSKNPNENVDIELNNEIDDRSLPGLSTLNPQETPLYEDIDDSGNDIARGYASTYPSELRGISTSLQRDRQRKLDQGTSSNQNNPFKKNPTIKNPSKFNSPEPKSPVRDEIRNISRNDNFDADQLSRLSRGNGNIPYVNKPHIRGRSKPKAPTNPHNRLPNNRKETRGNDNNFDSLIKFHPKNHSLDRLGTQNDKNLAFSTKSDENEIIVTKSDTPKSKSSEKTSPPPSIDHTSIIYDDEINNLENDQNQDIFQPKNVISKVTKPEENFNFIQTTTKDENVIDIRLDDNQTNKNPTQEKSRNPSTEVENFTTERNSNAQVGAESEILEEREKPRENKTEVVTEKDIDKMDGLININLSIQSTTSRSSNLDTASTKESLNGTTIIDESENSNNSMKDDVLINSTKPKEEKTQLKVPLHHWDRAIHANEINRSIPNLQPMNPDVQKPSITTSSVTIPTTLVSSKEEGK